MHRCFLTLFFYSLKKVWVSTFLTLFRAAFRAASGYSARMSSTVGWSSVEAILLTRGAASALAAACRCAVVLAAVLWCWRVAREAAAARAALYGLALPMAAHLE